MKIGFWGGLRLYFRFFNQIFSLLLSFFWISSLFLLILPCRLDKVSLTSVKSTGSMPGTFALRVTLDVETP